MKPKISKEAYEKIKRKITRFRFIRKTIGNVYLKKEVEGLEIAFKRDLLTFLKGLIGDKGGYQLNENK